MGWTDSSKLYDLVEKLQEQAEESATRSAILITLNELNTYAQKQFEQDERTLATLRSTELKSRKTLHQRLLDQLVNHTENFKDSSKNEVSPAFLKFLQNWMQVHSQNTQTMPDGLDGN
jgi:hemerythrin-like metal-binding protein